MCIAVCHLMLIVVASIFQGSSPCCFHVARTAVMVSCIYAPFRLQIVPRDHALFEREDYRGYK